MAQTSTATKSAVGRAGLGLTIASVVVLAVPLIKILFAAVAGNVTLNSADDVTRLFTIGIVVTALAGVLGLVAAILHGMGLGKGFTTGKGVNMGISVVVLLASVGLLFTTILPRANAVQNLNNKIVPFGYAVRDNCQTPLDNVQKDYKQAKADSDNNATNDAAFATAMKADIAKLQGDATALSNGLNKLNATTVPDSKYQALLDGCKKDVQGEVSLLTDTSYIDLTKSQPAIAALLPPALTKFSAISLLTGAAGVADGSIPLAGFPPHSAQVLTSAVLAQIVAASDPELTAEGDKLRADINNTLKDNLAPFKAGPSLQA